MARANCHGSPESCREWDGSPRLKRTETDINSRLLEAFPLACWDRRPILSMGVKLWCTLMSHDYKKEWRRKKRNLHRDSGEDAGDSAFLTVLESVWPCGNVLWWPFPPCLGIKIYRGGLWMHPCGNYLNQISSSEAVRVVGFQTCSDWWWS